MSAGIFLYVIPGGKLQLLVLLTQSDNGKKTKHHAEKLSGSKSHQEYMQNI